MGEIRVALCDDDRSWLDDCARMISSFGEIEGLKICLRMATAASELLASGVSEVPDVLFCDIEMSGELNGIELVRRVNATWPTCQVVYVTNHLYYASDVYATEHVWFVLKEDFERRLPEVMDKVSRHLRDAERVIVLETVAHELVSVSCHDIVFLERRGRVTTVMTSDAAYTVPDRLPVLLEQLPAWSFARTHGSYAVNLGQVRTIRSDSVELMNGSEVPLSRRHARSLRESYLAWADDHTA